MAPGWKDGEENLESFRMGAGNQKDLAMTRVLELSLQLLDLQ